MKPNLRLHGDWTVVISRDTEIPLARQIKVYICTIHFKLMDQPSKLYWAPFQVYLYFCKMFNDNIMLRVVAINTLRPRENGRKFPDDIFKCSLWSYWILIKISLKFISEGPIIYAYIWVTRSQWVAFYLPSPKSSSHIYHTTFARNIFYRFSMSSTIRKEFYNDRIKLAC